MCERNNKLFSVAGTYDSCWRVARKGVGELEE